jgi:hypothetical protein
VFDGKKLEVFISKRYESTYGVLSVSDEVHTMAIFKMRFDGGEETGFFLPATITMKPSEVETHSDAEGKFYKLIFYKGDVFIKSENVVMNPQLGYVLFREFVFLGKMPDYIGYEQSGFMFNDVENIVGLDFKTNNVVFETIFAHLHRDPSNVMTPYRLTNMKKEPIMIPLREVQHAATSTSGRIMGSFFDDAINSSVVNQSEDTSEVEDLFRM